MDEATRLLTSEAADNTATLAGRPSMRAKSMAFCTMSRLSSKVGATWMAASVMSTGWLRWGISAT